MLVEFLGVRGGDAEDASMAGFGHGPAEQAEPENEAYAQLRARYGLVLFGLYLALYGGFVLLNAFVPEWMEITPLWGVNLAILYGFGLIAAALLLALVYSWLCTAAAGRFENPTGDEGGRP
jgi:uncharacterized membrane protein (DUF485 family)